MKLRFWLSISMFGASVLSLAKPSVAQSFDFVSIDVPCDECPGGITPRTAVIGISPAGDIVGDYTDTTGRVHGFLLSSGQFTTIDFPGAVATEARGITSAGVIVGDYTAPVSDAPPDSPAYCPEQTSLACVKGFLHSHGRFSTVLFPGHPGAIPHRVMPDGTIYGCYHDFDYMASMVGFARFRHHDHDDPNEDRQGNRDHHHGHARFTYISLAEGGGELADPTQSVPASMNNSATPDGGTIVGNYTDLAANHDHGYIVQEGNFQSYDVPDSTLTRIWDINPAGDFVGIYRDGMNLSHAFLQLTDGSTPITLDYPDAVFTSATGINPDGAIVGLYTDASGHTHGFLAVPASDGGNDQ
jgi:probable HAF family extracellular repeat protein